MKRPTIKGTPLHKASIAKAKSNSIVAQTRTTAESSLVGGSDMLGRSYVPAAIDFSMKTKAIDWGKTKKDDDGGAGKSRDKKGDKKVTKIKTIKKLKKLKEADKGKPDLKKRKVPGYELPEERKTATKIETRKAKELKVSAAASPDLNSRVAPEYTSPKSMEVDITSIEPRKIKTLPTNSKKQELQKSISTAHNKNVTDKFEKAAKGFGYDLSTPEGYAKAEDAMDYRESDDTWVNPRGTYAGDGEKRKIVKTEQEIAEEKRVKDDLEVIRAKQAKDLQNIKSAKQVARENLLDEKMAKKNQRKSDKEDARLKKNEGIRERNRVVSDARAYYGEDIKLTQSRLDNYKEIMELQRNELNNNQGIEEQDDIDPWEIDIKKRRDLNSNTPKNNPDQKTEQPKVTRRRKMLDKKYEDSGPSVRANMVKEGYVPAKGKSLAAMRDNRIYRNAKPDGPVRRNMIESGYTPQ